MKFHAEVVQGRGAPQTIEIESATPDEARQQMLSRGYTVLALRSTGVSVPTLFVPAVGRPRLDIAVFVEQLRDLLRAGLSVIEALETLQRGSDRDSRQVFESLAQRLRGGERLSQAMAAQPAFPPLLVALVRACEWTSDLPQALTRFLEHEQRVAELRHRISSVAIYPALLAAVGSGVLLFLLLYVMPRFARVFEGMRGELPWSARAMVWWAQWLAAHGAWLLVVGAALGAGLAAVVASRQVRARMLQRLLQWAPLRERLRTYFLARWYRATGMLVEGGIPLPEALGLSNGLLPLALQVSGQATERALREGHSPAQAYAQAGMATSVAEQLIRAGERTGDLGAVLGRIAQYHDAEVARALERGMRAVEPLVMVLIGLGVGAIVVLMYLPIFELAAAVQ